MASGKMLTAKILHHIVHVEQWANPLLIEHTCAAYLSGALSRNDASVLIKLEIDSLQDEFRIGRRLNTKLGEASSIFSSPRWFSYLHKILTRHESNKPLGTLLLMLHGFFECIDLLDFSLPSNSFYISQFRYPLSPSVVGQYLKWVRRWDENSRAIQPRTKVSTPDGKVNLIPFYFRNIPGINEDWSRLSLKERALKLICFQAGKQITNTRKFSQLENCTLTPVFFEDLTFSPVSSIDYITSSITASADASSSLFNIRLLKRFLRSSKLPRANPDDTMSLLNLNDLSCPRAPSNYFKSAFDSFILIHGSEINSTILENCYNVSEDYQSLYDDLGLCNEQNARIT